MSASGFCGGAPGDGKLWLLRLPPRVKNAIAAAKRGDEVGQIEVVADGDGSALRLRLSQGGDASEYDLMPNDAHGEVQAFSMGAMKPAKKAKDEPLADAMETEQPKAKKPKYTRPPQELYAGKVIGQPSGSFSLKPLPGVGYRRVCRGRLLSSYGSTRVVQELDAADVPSKAASEPITLFKDRAERMQKEGKAPLKAPKNPTIEKQEMKSRLFLLFGSGEAEPISMKEVKEQLDEAHVCLSSPGRPLSERRQ
ncbi:hypothetical protein M885DRAFT_532700 [Pelagophyceae sp. CCMP2097]|nr:hypothetical protein M885DRAFT_532700 [Pelagophyceae sp. CCMP2097]